MVAWTGWQRFAVVPVGPTEDGRPHGVRVYADNAFKARVHTATLGLADCTFPGCASVSLQGNLCVVVLIPPPHPAPRNARSTVCTCTVEV